VVADVVLEVEEAALALGGGRLCVGEDDAGQGVLAGGAVAAHRGVGATFTDESYGLPKYASD